MEAENTQLAIEKRDDQEERLELNVHIQEQLDKYPSSQEETYFSEAFYEEQASRLKDFFSDMHDPNRLRILERQLNRIKTIMDKLKMPWVQYIPMMHNAFMLNYDRLEGRDAKAHTLRLTTELISLATFLSQNGRLINNMSTFFHTQIVELNEILDKEK